MHGAELRLQWILIEYADMDLSRSVMTADIYDFLMCPGILSGPGAAMERTIGVD